MLQRENVGVVSVKAVTHGKKQHLGYLTLKEICNVLGGNVTYVYTYTHTLNNRNNTVLIITYSISWEVYEEVTDPQFSLTPLFTAGYVSFQTVFYVYTKLVCT